MEFICGRCRKIIEIFQRHNEQIEQLISKDFSSATLQRYKTSLEHTRNFTRLEVLGKSQSFVSSIKTNSLD
jgi:hypothetical protein